MSFLSYIFHLNKDFSSYEKKSVQEFYEIFKKLLKKKSVIESMFIHVAGLSSYQDIFLGIFLSFQSILSAELLSTTIFKLFDIFPWNLTIIQLSWLKPIHLSSGKNKYLKIRLKNNQISRFYLSQILWNLSKFSKVPVINVWFSF